jgi:Ca2+-binding EF-hand superfamily protein
MKKASSLFVAGSAAALLSLAAAHAQTPPTPSEQPAPQSQGASFESLDTNSDGKISKTEAEANASVKAQFTSYDLNGDGFIERAEVDKANSSQSKAPQQ